MTDINKIRQQRERKAVLIGKMETHLWRRFGGTCRLRGVTIRDVLETLIKQWLKEQE